MHCWKVSVFSSFGRVSVLSGSRWPGVVVEQGNRLCLFFSLLGCFSYFCCLLELYQSKMDTRYCSICIKKLSSPFFLRDASSLPSSKVFATCYKCRERGRIQRDKRKRPALQEIDPNISQPPAQRQATPISQAPF